MNKMFILLLWKLFFVYGSNYIFDISFFSIIEGIVTVCFSVGLGEFVLCNLSGYNIIINSNIFYFINIMKNKIGIYNVWNRF